MKKKLRDNDMRGHLWTNEGKRKPLSVYYASGEQKPSERAICVNLPDDQQVVININDVIKVLKTYKRVK